MAFEMLMRQVSAISHVTSHFAGQSHGLHTQMLSGLMASPLLGAQLLLGDALKLIAILGDVPDLDSYQAEVYVGHMDFMASSFFDGILADLARIEDEICLIEDIILGLEDASPSVADSRLREGVDIVKALERHGLTEIREVRLGGHAPSELPALRVGIERDGGPEVLLGSGDLDPKLERLAALLAAPFDEVREASSIDLRFGDRMVLRSGPPEGSGAAASAGGRPRSPWTRSVGEASDRTERG